MSIELLLLSSIVATAITFRKELSGQTDLPAPRFSFDREGKPIETKPSAYKVQECVNVERPVHQQNMLKKALSSMDDGNYEQALSFADRLVKLEKDDPFYRVIRGDCYTKLGRTGEALESYDIVMNYDGRKFFLPVGLRPLTEKQIELLEKIQCKDESKPTKTRRKERTLTNLSGALEQLAANHRKMREKYPRVVSLLDNATRLIEKGDFKGAAPIAYQLCESKPSVGQFRILYATCLEGVGDIREALSQCNRALRLRLPDWLLNTAKSEVAVLKQLDKLLKEIEERDTEEEIRIQRILPHPNPVRSLIFTYYCEICHKSLPQDEERFIDGMRACNRCYNARLQENIQKRTNNNARELKAQVIKMAELKRNQMDFLMDFEAYEGALKLRGGSEGRAQTIPLPLHKPIEKNY
jgi:Flp pilus assembly protein TadD